MFTFFNTVEVLPESCVDAIHHFLKDSGLAVPVVLKAKSGMQGFVALHAWIPKSDPVCRLLPTELVVAEERAAELRHLLNRFVREVQEVVKMTEREPRPEQPAESDDGEIRVEGRARMDL